MEGIHVVSSPISDIELMPKKMSPQVEVQVADTSWTNHESKSDSQPTVTQPGGEPLAMSKIRQHEHGLRSMEETTEKLKQEKKSPLNQQHILSSEDESEVEDMFHHGNWSVKMRNWERLLESSGQDSKMRKQKTVEFNSNLKNVFNDDIDGTSTPALARTPQGDLNILGSDPVMQQIEQMKQAFDLENEQLKEETASGFGWMGRDFEVKKEKIRQELAETTLSHLDNSSPRAPNPRSSTSRDIGPQMNTVMDVVNHQSRGGSLSPYVLGAFKVSPEHQQKHFSRDQEANDQSSHQDINNSSEEFSRQDRHHDLRRSRWSNNDTGQSKNPNDPGCPYNKIPTKHIEGFGGNQDWILLLKARFQTIVEEQALVHNLKPETVIEEDENGATFSRFQANIQKETTTEARSSQANFFPWFPVIQKGPNTGRKKQSEGQPDMKIAVVAKLDHTTIKRLWGLLQDEVLSESDGLKLLAVVRSEDKTYKFSVHHQLSVVQN